MDADLARELRRHSADAVNVAETNQRGLDDDILLQYAAGQQRVLVTHNIRHFIILHRRYLDEGHIHAGIVVSKNICIGHLLTRLLHLMDTAADEEMNNQLRFL